MIANSSKYKLIVSHVVSRISNGTYTHGSWIPSINAFIKEYKLSRDTVFTGLNELKAKGIIDSKPGLGYYVASTRVSQHQRVFLLFNEFNAFKESLYNSFTQSVSNAFSVDLFFHNYNREVFETLIREAYGKYTTYVIMSGKFEGIGPLLEKLNGRVYLLDHFHPELLGKYSAVFQNFEKDTYEALMSGKEHIEKYQKIIMVQADEKEPYERYHGLARFSREQAVAFEYVDSLGGRSIQKGELYMVVNDRDLVDLIKQVERKRFVLGKDIGIISYNETELKEILSGGITTLSTDFHRMGETLFSLLQEKVIRTIENPWKFTIRKSL